MLGTKMSQGVEELARYTPQERVFDRLASLPDEARRIKFLRRLRLISPSTVEQLDEAVRVQVRVDLGKAHGLAEAAVTLANELGDDQSKAYALRAKANALSFLGKNREASELHAQAARLFDAKGNTVELGRTLSTSIQPLILLGEYDSAHAAASRARAVFSQAGEDSRHRLARLEINVGNIFHRQDRFREALERYRHAYSQLLPLDDREGIVVALHNSAMCLTMLNEYEESQTAYEQLREFCQERDMPLATAQAEYNIAYLFYLRGQYARAIDMLRAAREAAIKAGDGHRAALCMLDLSEIYLELNLTPEAMELAQLASLAFERLGMR
jgi:tetratricopeptide (TPR) repeat protein